MKPRPLYPGLKLLLVPLVAGFPLLIDGDLADPKTFLKSALAAATALYALCVEPPRINKDSEPKQSKED